MRLKRVLVPVTIVVIAFCNLSMSWSPAQEILDEQDVASARNERSALSSRPEIQPAWESFSEWQCFPIEALEVEFIKYCQPEGCDPQTDYDIPSIGASYGGHYYQFEYDLEADSSEQIAEEWKNLIQGQSSVCIYAALFPEGALGPHDPNQSLWALYNIKTKKGPWRTYQ